MTVTPSGVFRLGTVCFESDYKNVLDFPNETARSNYFNSVASKTFTDFTYMKKDNAVVVGENIDNIIGYNYCWYQNSGFTNKTYYCFVTNMEYLSENSTRITFTTDVYQTYLFDKIMKPCFVAREHTNDDSIGANIIPEDLETGEYIFQNEPNNVLTYEDGSYLMMGVSELPEEIVTEFTEDDLSRVYNGIYSGLYYIIFTSAYFTSSAIRIYDSLGKGDAIHSIFIVPKFFGLGETGAKAITKNFEVGTDTVPFTFLIPITSNGVLEIIKNQGIVPHRNFGDYIPKNNKCLIYPYRYFTVSNNNGICIPFHYEQFKNNAPFFSVVASLSEGCDIRFIPRHYLDNTLEESDIYSDYEYGVNAGKFPICSWTSDVYTNWLTQNGVNIGIDIATAIGKTAAGLTLLGTGNPLFGGGLMASAMGDIGNLLGTMSQKDTVPAQVKGNTNSGNLSYSIGKTCFTITQYCIKEEMIRCIDGFFDMFGYKTNRVKLPNERGRLNWNYVETRNCNVCGSIPQEDLEKLRRIYNTGVTIWHNSATFLDYSANNSIV